MSTHKRIDRICIAVILLSLAITLLFMNGERLGIAAVIDEDAEEVYESAFFSGNDLKADWDASEATVIVLKGDSAEISGKGAYWSDGTLTIVQSGEYVLSGELTDGKIAVDAKPYSKVWLLLNGVSVTCGDDACLRIDQADKVFLTLAEGTQNSLTGAQEYSETALSDGTDAVLYSHDDLTINGKGALRIAASVLNGITSKDDLIITGGTISVSAPEQGIKVNDRFRFTGADLTVQADGDGIHSDMEVLIEGGTISIAAGDDGIHADSLIQIYGGGLDISECYEGMEAAVIEQYGGEVSIESRDDGINANGYTGMAFGGGPRSEASQEEQTTLSAEETYVLIEGGKLTITNSSGMDADGIDSNGNLTITGGEVRISMANNGGNSALDCGTEAGGQAVITGGTVIACGNYSMAESFDSTSAQCSILYNIGDGVEDGSTVSLLNAQGEALLSAEVPLGFSSVILSCPEIAVGESYTIRIGDAEEAITLEEVSASFGDSSSQMFPGTMNWGGMQRRERMEEGTPPPLPEEEEGNVLPDFGQDGRSATPAEAPKGRKDGMGPMNRGGHEMPGNREGTDRTQKSGTEPGEAGEERESMGQGPGSPDEAAGMQPPGFGGMEPPQGMSPPDQGEKRAKGLSAEASSVQDAVIAPEAGILAAVSGLVLAAGVLFAALYKESRP